MSLTKDIDRAFKAAEAARLAREDMRWKQKPGDPDREATIAKHIDLLAEAMKPIRSAIGGIQFGRVNANQHDRLRDASQAIQYEHKRLKKLRR